MNHHTHTHPRALAHAHYPTALHLHLQPHVPACHFGSSSRRVFRQICLTCASSLAPFCATASKKAEAARKQTCAMKTPKKRTAEAAELGTPARRISGPSLNSPASGSAEPVTPVATAVVADSVNANYFATVNACLEKVLSHPVFAGARGMKPLMAGPTADRNGMVGSRAPVDKQEIIDAVAGGTSVSGGGNLFWLMFNFSASPGVPISHKKVNALSDYHYGSGQVGPPCLPIHVALPANIQKEQLDQATAAGELKLTSPPECLHAWLFAVHKAIVNNANDTQLRKWLQVALSVEITFTKLDSVDEIHFNAVQKREDLAANAMFLGRTALGRILEVAGFKARKEQGSGPMSSAAVAELYKAHCRIVNPDEQVTTNFVDNALTIQRRLLSQGNIMNILLDAEDLCVPTAFDAVSKLYGIVVKAKTPR